MVKESGKKNRQIILVGGPADGRKFVTLPNIKHFLTEPGVKYTQSGEYIDFRELFVWTKIFNDANRKIR